MSFFQRARRDGAKYLNPVETHLVGLSMTLKVLPLYLKNKAETVPRTPLGPFHTEVRTYLDPPSSGLRVTWFGHSSSLVEQDGVRLLIDPVWDRAAGPFGRLGPKRFFPPTLAIAQLPIVDAVLISHDHYDHLGSSTVKELSKRWPKLRWIAPPGVAKLLHGFGVATGQVTELDWTESTIVRGQNAGAETLITALPARHFSGRSISNRFHTLWSSYVLAGPRHRVYYGADSGLWDGFKAAGEEFGPFDLCMLEIGAFHELWREIHMGPDGAADAFQQLGGGLLMPIHWGLFNLALHSWRQPIERIEELAKETGLALFVPAPGCPTEVAEINSGWWKKYAENRR